MRSPVVLCAVVLLLATSFAIAQDSSTGVLTDAERDLAVKHLQVSRQKFLDSISNLSEAQWKFKPAPDRWSIAEVAEHVALSEEMFAQWVPGKIVKGSPAAPEKRAAAAGKEQEILEKMPQRAQKAQAPEILKPVNRWSSREELLAAFNTDRDKNIEWLRTTQEPLRLHFAKSVFGEIDAWQWMLYASAHAERHTHQIEEVKADPGYPKE